MTGETFFNKATHQWIFIHEMGHWWRPCQLVKASHYDEEIGANRIAVAYWRQTDSAFLHWKIGVFEQLLAHFPNPVPAGTTREQYLNANYETVGATAAYRWYQATMIVEAYHEQPPLSFMEAIKRAGK